jgi:hypothetical protein
MTATALYNAPPTDAALDGDRDRFRATAFAQAATGHLAGKPLSDYLACRVAAAWRDSNASPLGEFAATGAIVTRSGVGIPTCSTLGEARNAMNEALDRPHAYTDDDAPALAGLVAYLEAHGERGPIETWNRVLGDPFSHALTFGDDAAEVRVMCARLGGSCLAGAIPAQV